MRRTVLMAFALVSVAACDGYVGKSEHQALLEVAKYTAWVKAGADGRDETIREIGTVQTGRLEDGEETTIALDVTGAHRAIVIAACDRNCSDLDLRVVTDDGRLIGLDDEEDDTPSVYIDEKKTNKLVLKIRMPQCSASSCAFAVKQLEYEDYVGGYGTCFAVSPNGLLLTALHVIDGASKINISFPDGRKGVAELFRSSEDNDLALLQTKLPTPTWLPLASAGGFAIGTPAFTVGYPAPTMLGSDQKFTEGNVSAVTGAEDSTLFQISVPIQPGNSGGPVLDYSGRVLGVVVSSIDEASDGTPTQLTNFARNARVASLLLPPSAAGLHTSDAANRQQAIARAEKSVCQIKAE